MQETQEMWVQTLRGEDPLKEEMTTHSSILAWEMPWTEEPGGLQSMGSQRVDTRVTEHKSLWGLFKAWESLRSQKTGKDSKTLELKQKDAAAGIIVTSFQV